MRPRRFLPSLKLLLALDAVVRHRSVTAAAQELGLTQSTVSRLLLTLEAQLGRELFARQRKRLIPTSAALAYQRDVARALDVIQRASMTLISNPEGGKLSLAVLPTFASHWLGPKLADFLRQHPGIALNMATRIGRVDFAGEAFDAAITYGEGAGPGLHHLKLFDERVTACAAPDFVARHDIAAAADLYDLPMLHLESRPTLWADWFGAQGCEPRIAGGMLLDQFSFIIQAAGAGLGVALLPDYLAQIEFAEGRLVPILRQAVPVLSAYWLTWPREKEDYPPLVALRSWIAQENIR